MPNILSKTLNKVKKKYSKIKYPKKIFSFNKKEKNKKKKKIIKINKRREPFNNDRDIESITKSLTNLEVKERIYSIKIDVSSKNINLLIEPKLSEEFKKFKTGFLFEKQIYK